MKKSPLYLFVIFSFLVIQSSFSQDKSYSNVYVEKKVDGTWSGTKKTTYSATLMDMSKGGPYDVSISAPGEEKPLVRLAINYETDTSDGKAFHKIVGGVWGDSRATSPSGSTEIAWVYMNKSVEEILSSDPKPFDVEIEFGDGSAVKYYISP